MTDRTVDAPSKSEPIRIQEATLARLLEWIRAADTKVSIVIALDTAMLGLLAMVAPARPEMASWIFWLLAGSTPTVVSLWNCARATFPHLEGPQRSHLFFGSIVALKESEYRDEVIRRGPADYLEDLIAQSYRNAEIAEQKYRHLKHAMIWLLVGTLPWLLALHARYRG